MSRRSPGRARQAQPVASFTAENRFRRPAADRPQARIAGGTVLFLRQVPVRGSIPFRQVDPRRLWLKPSAAKRAFSGGVIHMVHAFVALRVGLQSPAGALLTVLAVLAAGVVAAAEPAISFTRDIKGILSNRCVRCHGPDAEDRHGGGEEGLRLDTFEGATEDLGGYAAIVPGKPAESELIARITETDPDIVMPPPEAGEPLSAAEVELLSRWIAAGAEYEPHWAYVPPVRPPVPAVADAAWPTNDIDRFILARLEAEGLAPQPEADRATLARRLALDLTGLPPTPEEVDAFVADAAPDAVERFIDRRLDHPGYGEHVARQWLDLARYADSAGYADDRPRTIWAWRDWVI